MGAWGVGITSNDAAQDLKSDYQAAFAYYDIEIALAKIDEYVRLEGYDESDESDWCDYYYSLANFMWKKGILTDEVRDTAVNMIDTGFGLEIWTDEGEKTLNKRKKVLAEFREMLLSPQPAKKKIKVDLYLNSVFDIGDYVAFRLQTMDKSYLVKKSSFDEDYFRSMDGKYVVIRKVQDHISYQSKIVPEVADHWIIYQLYCAFFDAIPDISQLRDTNWAYMEGQKIYHDAPDKSPYMYCESSLFYYFMLLFILFCGCGGTGRRARLRIWWISVQVQVLSPAPNKHRNYDTKRYRKCGAYFFSKDLIYKAFLCFWERDKCPYQNCRLFISRIFLRLKLARTNI